jgi:2-polyprenyl-3-methyl-5-hydroxy-6-metoxy-1,4-benzoquinol methylase
VILPRLDVRDREARERMDDPACDEAALRRTYAAFRVVNAVVAGWRTTYATLLRPLLRDGSATTLLDVGSGGGDLARALAGWAARDGHGLQVTGIDPDPRAHAWAASRPARPGVTFRRATTADLVAEGARFDLVVSNHVLHHLDDRELAVVLDDTRRLAARRVVHSDIRRSRTAYLLFSVGTLPFFPGSFIRADGLVSIRRSYTVDELGATAPPGWEARPQAPWRTLLVHDVGV